MFLQDVILTRRHVKIKMIKLSKKKSLRDRNWDKKCSFVFNYPFTFLTYIDTYILHGTNITKSPKRNTHGPRVCLFVNVQSRHVFVKLKAEIKVKNGLKNGNFTTLLCEVVFTLKLIVLSRDRPPGLCVTEQINLSVRPHSVLKLTSLG